MACLRCGPLHRACAARCAAISTSKGLVEFVSHAVTPICDRAIAGCDRLNTESHGGLRSGKPNFILFGARHSRALAAPPCTRRITDRRICTSCVVLPGWAFRVGLSAPELAEQAFAAEVVGRWTPRRHSDRSTPVTCFSAISRSPLPRHLLGAPASTTRTWVKYQRNCEFLLWRPADFFVNSVTTVHPLTISEVAKGCMER